MRIRPIRTRRGLVAAAALLTALGAVTAVPAVAAPSAPESDTRTVTYRGYQLKVPASWPVVDLTEQPDACVRFDRPTVYLGSPAEASSCPTGLVGRTQGLIVEPLAGLAAGRTGSSTARASKNATNPAVAARPVSRNDEIQVAVESAGVLVTAAHTDATEASVRRILRSAKLTSDAKPRLHTR